MKIGSLFLVLALLSALGLAACGGGGSSTPAAASPTPPPAAAVGIRTPAAVSVVTAN